MATFTLNAAGIAATIAVPGSPVQRDMLVRGVRVSNQAKRLCPVDTGRLRASIGVRQEQRAVLTTIIGTNVDYALFVHDGTRYMTGRPYLRDALPAAGG